MKKLVVLMLVLFLSGTLFVGAEDAKVMPLRTGRLYLAPAFAFANGAYNENGKYENYGFGGGSMQALNLVMALEYGVVDWVTAAVQWKPGVNLWSKVDSNFNTFYKGSQVNTRGVSDLFVGAKVQILGEKAPVKTETFRLALAPGFKIPLPGPDFEKQAENLANGDMVTAANLDYHVFGAGVRFYFDYIINKNFFINFYSEFIGYPVKGDMEKSGQGYMTMKAVELGMRENPTQMQGGTTVGQAIKNAYAQGDILEGGKVDYGYDLTFELEPVFTAPLATGIVFTGGLPITYKFTPGKKYDDLSLTDSFKGKTSTLGQMHNKLLEGAQSNFDDATANFKSTHAFTITPNVAFFFQKWFLPTEFKIQYSAPIGGKNERAMHTIGFIAKIYFKI